MGVILIKNGDEGERVGRVKNKFKRRKDSYYKDGYATIWVIILSGLIP
ncbi:hypothetical protein [Paenibacillus larvae]|nr:hypothetical protein [Paenibacillus larvae]MDT2232912.1 hypothetical protein [Paenibacillus larvae]